MAETLTSHRTAGLVLVFFALMFALVSFPNHLLFRTYALDLGLYTHALWHYAHGHVHDSSLFLVNAQPILADHFDLYLPIFSLLSFVFGSWTLLLVQWVAILVGAWGIRALLLQLKLTSAMALLGMTTFMLYFGVYASMAYDYHSNVVSTMVLPWCLLALIRGNRSWSVVLVLFMLCGKENMGLWLGPSLWLLATDRSLSPNTRWMAFALGGVAFLWSVSVIGWVMPSLAQDGTYAHFDYGILGESLKDIPSAILQKPLELLRALFTDHLGGSDSVMGTSIKIEFWWMMMVSGGWAFLFRPRWGLMALPIIAQKMWQDDPGKWSVVAQYGVEFAPLLGIAVPLALSRIHLGSAKRILSWMALVLTLSCTIRFMDNTVAYQDRSRIRLYQVEHYQKPYALDPVRRALALIPSNAGVSAQSPAVPHLALRDHLYQYPIIRDADYILLMLKESPYPLAAVDYKVKAEGLLTDPAWSVLVKSDVVLLFTRRSAVRAPQ